MLLDRRCFRYKTKLSGQRLGLLNATRRHRLDKLSIAIDAEATLRDRRNTVNKLSDNTGLCHEWPQYLRHQVNIGYDWLTPH